MRPRDAVTTCLVLLWLGAIPFATGRTQDSAKASRLSARTARSAEPARPPETRPLPAGAALTPAEYLKFLQDENKAHRDYVETYYNHLAWGLGIIFAALAGLLAWAPSRVRREVKDYCGELTKPHLNKILDEESRVIDAARRSVDELLGQMRSAVDEVKSRLASVTDQVELVKAAEYFRASGSLASKAVLWVDDDPKEVEFPHKVLANAGIFIERRSSTEGALEALSHDRFDVMVSNLEREGNDVAGLELIQRMKEAGIAVPTVIFSRPWRLKLHGPALLEAGARIAEDYGSLLKDIAAILNQDASVVIPKVISERPSEPTLPHASPSSREEKMAEHSADSPSTSSVK